MRSVQSLVQQPGLEPADKVILALRQLGPQSRTELVTNTALAKSTVSHLVKELLDEGILISGQTAQSNGRGRPRTNVALNPEIGTWIGLEFGLRHVRAAQVDVAHNILATAEVALPVYYSLEQALEAAEQVVREAGGRSGDSVGLGIGAAVPGPIDPGTGILTGTSILPGWSGVNIAEVLSDRFGREVLVENDANCGLLAEHAWGAGRGIDDLAYFKIHSGIGGALIVGGSLLHGRGGVAGEFGHVTLDPVGPVCRCGNRGCLEMYASVPAVLDQLSTVTRPLTLPELSAAVSAGEPAALRALADAGAHVGQAAAAVSNIVAPTAFVIGGVLAEFGETILGPAREAFARYSIHSPSDGEDSPLRLGELSRQASALGAVILVMSRMGTVA